MAITLDGTNGINSSGVIVAPDGSASAPSITNDGDTNTGIFFPAADTIAFAEGGAEAMRIDSSGNVGIGTTSFLSGAKFQVKTATDKNLFIGSNSVGYLNDAGSSWVQTDVKGSTITFGTGQFAVEAARIDSSGNLLVGVTADPSNSGSNGVSFSKFSTNYEFHSRSGTSGLAYVAVFYNNNGTVGNINTNGSTTSYATTSDYRLKENIAPMTGALATVAQLNPVTYNWKSDGSAGQGFIAHELQAVVPDCVSGEKDAVDADGNPQYQGVDTSFLVATLTAAIKEQQTIIKSLQARIEALENNNV